MNKANGKPGGPRDAVQYNDGGGFGGDAGLTRTTLGQALIRATYATGTLTLAVQPTPGDTITVGSQSYTFVAGAQTNPGDITIGGVLADTQLAVLLALSGFDYFNVPNTDVTLSGFAANVLTLTALASGAAGNAVATTETFTSASNFFGAATLTGGTDGTTSGYVVADGIDPKRLKLPAPTALTLASQTISITQMWHTVVAETPFVPDTISTIWGGAIDDILLLRAPNGTTAPITISTSGTNVTTVTEQPLVLDSPTKWAIGIAVEDPTTPGTYFWQFQVMGAPVTRISSPDGISTAVAQTSEIRFTAGGLTSFAAINGSVEIEGPIWFDSTLITISSDAAVSGVTNTRLAPESGTTDDLRDLSTAPFAQDEGLLQVLTVFDPTHVITVHHNDGGAAAGNKILLDGNCDAIVTGNRHLVLWYDWQQSIWKELARSWHAIYRHSAPDDADIETGECLPWLDPTPGAAKFMIKAKNSGGTVVSGEIALI